MLKRVLYRRSVLHFINQQNMQEVEQTVSIYAFNCGHEI